MKLPSDQTRLDELLQAAGRAADGAARILLNHFGKLKQIDEKFQAGLVSEADRESEAFIVDALRAKFPEHRFLGEESGLSDGVEKESGLEKTSSSGSLWIIDPLDGTTNYVHQFPVFCISIGLEIDGELVLGLIDAPKMGLRYHAVKGGGAFLNGEPIRVSNRTQFKDGLFATGFSSVDDGLATQFAIIEDTIKDARGIRRAGAAALDLCFVAQGIFDVFWEKNLSSWDTAAGAVIASEAGAIVTDYEGRPYRSSERNIIAGSPTLHPEILARIRKHRAARA